MAANTLKLRAVVGDLMGHKRPDMPPPMLPYIQAAKATPPAPEQMTLDSD